MQSETLGAHGTVVVDLGQEPVEQARDDEEDEDDGDGIDDELAHEAEQCPAVQLPQRGEERHAAVVVGAFLQRDGLEMAVGGTGDEEMRAPCDEEAVAALGREVVQPFVAVVVQSRWRPSLPGGVDVELIL